MADNLTVEQRKKNMQHIKSKDTKIEIALRKALWNKGYRYRKNYCLLPGKPDIVLTKYKIAIFCDSEFFHGKDKQLLFEGWTVIRFWGKDIIKKTDECVRVVEETIFDLKIGDAEDQLCELSEENEWIQNK